MKVEVKGLVYTVSYNDQPAHGVQLQHLMADGSLEIASGQGPTIIEAFDQAIKLMFQQLGIELKMQGRIQRVVPGFFEKPNDGLIFRAHFQWSFPESQKRENRISEGFHQEMPLAFLQAFADFYRRHGIEEFSIPA